MSRATHGEVYDRADFRCEIAVPGVCTMPYSVGLHLHHRKTRAQGGENSALNLLALCAACHAHAHAHPAKAYSMGWLVKGWEEPADVEVTSYRNDR